MYPPCKLVYHGDDKKIIFTICIINYFPCYNVFMKKSKKNIFYTFLYLLLLYLGMKLIPFEKISDNQYLVDGIQLVVFLILLFLCFYEVRKSKAVLLNSYKEQTTPLLLILLLPLIFSNLIYGMIFNVQPISSNNNTFLFVISSIICVIIEEIIFRFFLTEFFFLFFKDNRSKELLVVTLQAICFSMMHCINFFGGNPLSVLMQLGYTLFLGFILGLINVSVKNGFIFSVIIHVLYNLINGMLIESLFSIPVTNTYIIYSITVGFYSLAIVFLCYLIFIVRRGKTAGKVE